MNVRDEVAAGHPAKVRPLAREAKVSSSLIYDMISRGEIEARRIGQRRLVITNKAARKLLGIEEATHA
jgi:hypothetical protein